MPHHFKIMLVQQLRHQTSLIMLMSSHAFQVTKSKNLNNICHGKNRIKESEDHREKLTSTFKQKKENTEVNIIGGVLTETTKTL